MSAFHLKLPRIARLTIAPFKGFFSFKTRTTTPQFDPDKTTLWMHLKEVARQDVILFWEPVINAVQEFKQERAKPH
jgi:hypothetical protein